MRKASSASTLSRLVQRLILTLALTLAMLIPAKAQTEPRKYALVIGNQFYQTLPPLSHPGNDARGMAETLLRLGYQVTVLTDSNTAVFWAVLDTFAKQAAGGQTTLFYYSGFAFQRDGSNYLLPVASRLENAGQIEDMTWPMQRILAVLQGTGAQTLVFMDASRDPGLPAGIATEAGLAQIQSLPDSFVSFASRPGSVSAARTTPGGNGAYTAALLENMEAPDLSIADLMIRVRNAVEVTTLGVQTPWDQSSLREQFYFAPSRVAPLTSLSPPDDALPEFEIVADTTLISAPTAAGSQVAALAPPAVANLPPAAPAKAAPEIAPLAPKVADAPSQIATSAPLAPVQANDLPPSFVAKTPTVPQPESPEPVPENLAAAMQSELKRIGCYGAGIDGDWGNQSRAALAAWQSQTNAAPVKTEPSAEVWRLLRAASEGVCPEPVAAPVQRRAAPERRTPTTQRRATTSPSAPATSGGQRRQPTCRLVGTAMVCR